MDTKDITNKVKNIVESYLGQIDNPTEDFSAIGLDSLDKVNLICDIEKEFNLAILDSEIVKLNNLNKILQELNVNELGTIVKERTIYVYENKYEFSFDNVESIGLFIEIEVINQIDNFEKDTYNLLNLMKELKIDLNMIERRKYIDYLVND